MNGRATATENLIIKLLSEKVYLDGRISESGIMDCKLIANRVENNYNHINLRFFLSFITNFMTVICCWVDRIGQIFSTIMPKRFPVWKLQYFIDQNLCFHIASKDQFKFNYFDWVWISLTVWWKEHISLWSRFDTKGVAVELPNERYSCITFKKYYK